MENSVDRVAIRENSPDRDFSTKSNKINQNLCNMLIRKASKKDILPCLELQKSYQEHYWSINDFKTALDDKSVIFFIAQEGNKILGMVIGYITPSKRSDAMLHETRVIKNQQGKGIGKSLVEAFCKEAFNKGAKEIYALIKEEHVPFYVHSCKFKLSDKWIECKKRAS